MLRYTPCDVQLGPVAILLLKLRSFQVKHGCYGVKRKPMTTMLYLEYS